jgi:hypothetical protein
MEGQENPAQKKKAACPGMPVIRIEKLPQKSLNADRQAQRGKTL